MTALKGAAVDRFVIHPDLKAGVILAYGPDGGLVRERADRLLQKFSAGGEPPIVLDGGELDADPGRLAVEAGTSSLFGGRPVLRVRAAGKGIVPTLSVLLDGEMDAIIVLEAGNLAPKDALRALAEASPRARTLPCYVDSAEDVERLVRSTFSEAGIAADADTISLVCANLGSDREITRRELEKLALFAADTKVLTRADVEALTADSAALATDAILDAIGTGRAAALDSAITRALASGTSIQALVTVAISHFAMLRRLRAGFDTGSSAGDLVDGMRPKPHFSRKDSLMQQVRQWDQAALAEAGTRLLAASTESRKRAYLADTIVRRAFLALSMLANAR